MTKKLVVLVALLALVTAPLAFAQDQQMANVLTVHTKLGHGPHYEGLLKKIFAAFKEVGLDRPIQVSSSVSDPGAYNFLLPFTDWTEYGEINAKINAAYAKIPDVISEAQETFTHTEQSIWMARPDLAYAPSSPRIGAGEAGFTRLVFFYPYPGKGLEFEARLKDFMALNKKHGNPNGTAAAQLAVGAEGPAYVIATTAESEADSFAEGAKWREKMAAEWQALAEKTGPLLRKIEYGSATPRPDLSYRP